MAGVCPEDPWSKLRLGDMWYASGALFPVVTRLLAPVSLETELDSRKASSDMSGERNLIKRHVTEM